MPGRKDKPRRPPDTEQGHQPLGLPEDIWRQNPEIIKRFLGVRRDYEQLCAEVEYILRKRIFERAIETASISSRAKTLNSFLEKLQRKHYDSPFEQLTDFAGARVVCLYRSDIRKIADIIRSEFEVLEDIDKTDQLAANQFGYGARHFMVQLGKASSGARYDDLKQFACEIQVRTVVQDAWAIIQHHMVYKRESQVPTQLQRKLNSLAGLFETVDDQFERIREEREAYLLEVRGSAVKSSTFLENELNLDTFKEYLKWSFPSQGLESWNGQTRLILDALLNTELKTLGDLDRVMKETGPSRDALKKVVIPEITKSEDGSFPSSLEPALALAVSSPRWAELIPWGAKLEMIINSHRMTKHGGG